MNRQRYALLFIAAAIVRFVWLALHADAAFAAFDQGDYRLYEIGAEHIAAVGDFSNSLFLARPPWIFNAHLPGWRNETGGHAG